MPEFPNQTGLPILQTYVADMCRERGFDAGTDLETFLLFTEEVGELARAIRNHLQLYQEPGKKGDSHLAHELADVLCYVLDLANRFGVDLESAFRDKEEINRSRQWIPDAS